MYDQYELCMTNMNYTDKADYTNKLTMTNTLTTTNKTDHVRRNFCTSVILVLCQSSYCFFLLSRPDASSKVTLRGRDSVQGLY